MPAAAGDRRTLWIVSLALVLVTGLLYLQVKDHAFLFYDDNKFLVNNEAIQQGLNAESIHWAFTNNHASLWLPATWISHTIDFALFGQDAGGHHLVNLALHLLNTVVLLLVLHRMTGRLWPSALVAALFALHPQHVESVAWVTERKDTLSTLFLFLTMGAYDRYVRGGARGAYALALGFFALGLMAKPMLVTVPILLLVMDVWPWQRDVGRWRPLVAEKIPFFALAAAASVATFLVGRAGGIVVGLGSLAVWPRIANALVSTATYPVQMFWPLGLRAQYMFRHDLPLWQVAGAAVLLATVTWLAFRWWRSRPWFAAGWAWYLVSLVPVSGILQQGSHAMADRYTYVALLGLFVMVAWGGAELLGRSRRTRQVAVVLSAFVLVGLGALTHRQAANWRDTVTLFSHALAMDPDDPIVLTYLVGGLAREGRHTEAVARLREALVINPELYTAHVLMARSLAKLGDHEGAARHFQAALWAYQDNAAVHFDLGTQQMQAGQSEAAIASFRRVLELEPAHTGALTNLGLTLLGLDRIDEANVVLGRLVDVAPDRALSHYNRACGLSRGGDLAGAMTALGRALELGYGDWDHIMTDPDLANLRAAPLFTAHQERYLRNQVGDGRWQEARVVGRQLHDKSAGGPSSRVFYAMALIQTGHASEAEPILAELQASLPAEDPLRDTLGRFFMARGDEARGRRDWTAATGEYRRSLTWMAADRGGWLRFVLALREAGELEAAAAAGGRALARHPDWPEMLATTGLMLLELDRRDQAMPMLERALDLAPDPAWADDLRGKMDG